MDDSTNNTESVSLNQNIHTQNSDYVESNDIPTDCLEQENIEQEIEQEKEIINYPEENNNENNSINSENDKDQNKAIDNNKAESTEQPVVEKNESIEKDSK